MEAKLINMTRKILFFFAIVFVTVGCSTHIYNYKNPDNSRVFKEDIELLKQYALCRCIYYAFDKNPIFNEDISPSVYQELSNYKLAGKIDQKIDSLAKLVAANIKPSPIADYGNKKPILSECIAFYKSKQLDSLTRVLIKDMR